MTMFEQCYLHSDSHYVVYVSYSDIHIIPLQNIVHVVALGPNVTIAVSLLMLKAACCASSSCCYIFLNDVLTDIHGLICRQITATEINFVHILRVSRRHLPSS